MTDFLKIGRFELRRQRLNLCIAFPLILLFALAIFGGFFPESWKENMTTCFLVIVSLGGFFLSLDVFTRDFQQETAPVFFTLPVNPWKVYLAKYLFSVFLVFLILFLAFMLHAFFGEGRTLQWFLSRHDMSGQFRDAVSSTLFFSALLLYFHASIAMWCIAFRGISGVAAAFFLIPGVFLLLSPSLVWVSREYHLVSLIDLEVALQLFLYALVFVFIGGIFWRRGIGLGRPMWILALKSLGILFAASILSFVVFYGIQINEYMNVLCKFEKMPGMEIPKGKISVIRAIREGQVPKSADDVLNTDLKTMVEIPVGDYGKYFSRQFHFMREASRFINDEVKAKRFGRAIQLMDAYEILPDCIIPGISWNAYIHFDPITMQAGISGNSKTKKLRLWVESKQPKINFSCHFILETSDLKSIWSTGLTLPFGKDTLPFLDVMIARLEKAPDWQEIPVKVLPSGGDIFYLYSSGGKELTWKVRTLRDILPGIEKHGFGRFCAAAAFIFRIDSPDEFFSSILQGGRLMPSIYSMKAWIWSIKRRADLARRIREKGLLVFRWPHQENDEYTEDINLIMAYKFSVRRKYLWLPRLKLRKYALEHGTLPEKLSDALSEAEITHSCHDGVLKLEYCVNPRYAKDYPEGTIVCNGYDGPRRFPHLHLLQRDGKNIVGSFYGEFGLDEPEPPLPEKRGAK